MDRQCTQSHVGRAHALKFSAVALALSSAMCAMAAENTGQRYSPGIGGSDMTSPLAAGWYGQIATVKYHANKIKGNDGQTLRRTSTIPALTTPPVSAPLAGLFNGTFTQGMPVDHQVDLKADVYAVLPRLTYISTNKVLGGNLGLTAMLPLVKRKVDVSGSGFSYPQQFANINNLSGGALQPAFESRISDGLQAAQGGSTVGIGDLEFAPLVHWEIGDHQSAGVALTMIIPTGDYSASRAVNAGYGNSYTFRPSFQYAYIGDGWDVGGRALLSFNTRNKDNGYLTGSIFNLDYQLMKFVSDDVRVGLQGYVVQQFGRDTQDPSTTRPTQTDLSHGNKMRVYAAGPAVAWIKNGGEMLLEGKFLKEFQARNRTEGQAFWLTVSKPL